MDPSILAKYEQLPPDQKKNCEDVGIKQEDCINLSAFSLSTTQPELGGKMDILFVVDSSGSMAEEQASLGENFGSLMGELERLGIDFRVAVTSTDACQSSLPSDLSQRRCPMGGPSSFLQGGFIGANGKKILTPTTPNVEALFDQYTNIGVNGSAFEHGLTSAFLGLQKSLNGQNPSFIRQNAFLSVIVISDEEDDGIGLGMKDAFSGVSYITQGLTTYRYTDDDFISYLQSIKSEGSFSVSAITGVLDPATNQICRSTNGNPLELGTQYINAAKKTGGSLQSICDDRWDNLLESLGGDLGAQISQIVLEHRALPQSIVVTVNNIQNSDWSYVEAAHAVKFNANALPPPGSAISITYLGVKN